MGSGQRRGLEPEPAAELAAGAPVALAGCDTVPVLSRSVGAVARGLGRNDDAECRRCNGRAVDGREQGSTGGRPRRAAMPARHRAAGRWRLGGGGRGRRRAGGASAPGVGSARRARRARLALHRTSRASVLAICSEPSTSTTALGPTISARSMPTQRLASLPAGRRQRRSARGIVRRAGRPRPAACAARRAAAMKFDLPPGSGMTGGLAATERRLGGGDAIRRRAGIASAGRAGARLQRMVGRQVRIDRAALGRGRRSDLARAAMRPRARLQAGRRRVAGSVGGGSGAPAAARRMRASPATGRRVADAGAQPAMPGRPAPAWSCRACRFRSSPAGRRRARACRGRPRASPGSSCPSA